MSVSSHSPANDAAGAERLPVLVAAIRTPIGRYRGSLKSVRADDLLAGVLREVQTRLQASSGNAFSGVSWDEVVVGCANQAGEDCRNVARLAALLAGVEEGVPAVTLNRLCGSGLSAVAYPMQAIRAGMGQAYLTGAVEQMSRSPLARLPESVMAQAPEENTVYGWRFSNPRFQELGYYCDHAEAAEALALRYGITRADQEAHTLASHTKALAALREGYFQAETAPVTDAQGKVLLARDECPREGLARERLGRLPAIRGQAANEAVAITAATASPYADGATAHAVCSLAFAQRHGLPVLAVLREIQTSACHPAEAGLALATAIKTLCQRNQLELEAISALELHEGYAASSLAGYAALGLNPADQRLNAWGSSLALGAPMALASSRPLVTLAHRLQAEGQRPAYGIAGLGIGMGQAMAVLLETPGEAGHSS